MFRLLQHIDNTKDPNKDSGETDSFSLDSVQSIKNNVFKNVGLVWKKLVEYPKEKKFSFVLRQRIKFCKETHGSAP